MSISQNIDLSEEYILVADDDRYGCMLLEKMLSRAGARIVCASDGKQAMNILKKERGITLAILDLLMPEFSGYEVAEYIKQIRPDVPVIACSADVLRIKESDCLSRGFFACLPKPFLPPKLYNVVLQAVLSRNTYSSG